MKKRNLPKNEKSNKINRQRDPIPWRYCFLTVVCLLILTAGFFFAARQHFSAIEYGIKNAKLRQQRDELANDQRQLYVSKELALTPTEIKKAAKKIGFQEFAENSIEAVNRKASNAVATVAKIADPKTVSTFLPKSADDKKDDSKPEKFSKDGDGKSKTAATGDNIRPRVVSK